MRRGSESRHGRRGFTSVELLVVIVVFALLTSMVFPRINEAIRKARVNRATHLIANDLEMAVAEAARQRRPVRLSCTCLAQTYTITDRTGGTVRHSRNLGAGSEYALTTLTFSTSPVEIFPSGVASSALTVTLGVGGFTRQITLSTGGQVRVVPL